MENAKLSTSDQRRHERFHLATDVKYKIINRQSVEDVVDSRTFQDDGKAVNISVSGVSLTTDVALRKGDYLKVEITLPGAQRPTRALAEVMWVEAADKQFKSGIRFLILLNEADDNSVRKFVDTLKAD
jgi:hypothetical protein